MTVCVVDASVVAAALLREDHTDKARALLASGAELLAPDYLHIEMANVAWKRFMHGDLTTDEALTLVVDAKALMLEFVPTQPLIQTALDLARRTRRSVYDCLYLTLAMQRGGTMWTADRRLVVALRQSPTGKHVRWIGSWAPST